MTQQPASRRAKVFPQISSTHQPASRRAKGSDDDDDDRDLKGTELAAKGDERKKSIKLTQTFTYLLCLGGLGKWFQTSVVE